jgi:tetratricopeptide (TPR) repeat protein
MNRKILRLVFFCFLFFLTAPVLWAETADDYYKEAAQFYSQKDYSHAFDAYQGATDLDPNPYRAYAGMGNCQYVMGNKAKAMEYYRKSLALYPQNTVLAQFVQNLRENLDAKGGPFDRGQRALTERRYKDAIPLFQEALLDDPDNLPAYYDQAYCQYLTGDRLEAALNFTYYGEKKKDPKVQSAAYRILASLTPDDQEWVDEQLSTSPPFTPPFHYSGIGLRLDTTVQFVGLKDFNDYAKSLSASGNGITASAPGVGFGADLNPFIQVADGIEAGLSFGGIFLGGFTAQINNNTVSDNGTINYDLLDAGLSLKARVVKFEKGKIRLFVEADPKLYFSNLTTANSDTTTGWGFIPAIGNFSSSGFGGLLKVGMEWKPLPSSLISLFTGYQWAKLSGFHGSAIPNGSTNSIPGQLEVERSSGSTQIDFVPDGNAPVLPPGEQLSPLTLDLSGVILGADLTILF